MGLTPNEINRLTKYYETIDHKVNYQKFLQNLENSNTRDHDIALYTLAEKLQKYLEYVHFSPLREIDNINLSRQHY